ncbi:hypothetical protein CPB84DRAFT_1750433 [Gymnopilus junonius]|uniref:Uncharacterized protein n=1 Tax=Gymnopilus junonius TaxID=109634 RepID=A0A9P5TJN3_GYMJU|nr:hypothetical protein CPB84DRAFT_1750433 [Gymnopilus junonius]
MVKDLITEDSGESNKKGYVNFKRVVWHEALREILESIRLYGQTGFYKTCGDNVLHWLFPIILILSADYEEQCVMALIRGLKGSMPCPVCLAPQLNLIDLSETYELRTKELMMKIYERAKKLNASEKEELLKEYGLRDVQNIFWEMFLCDPYQALSWDGLHAHQSGLFADHIFPELKCLVGLLPRWKEKSKQLDRYIDETPHWRGLNHFSEVMKVEFTDGSKFGDIAKLLLYAAYDILTAKESPAGYALLKVLRSFLDLHMYASLTLHFESMTKAGETALLDFEKSLKEYSSIDIDSDKNWNFIKAHSHKHVFNDIWRKGVARNFSTKPNEKAHRPLKDFYQLMTNFKDFGVQIDDLDDAEVERLNLESEDAPNKTNPPCTIGYLESQFGHNGDSAFKNFWKRLSKALTSMLGTHINLGIFDEISPYQSLRVNYESKVSARQMTDII